MTRDEYIEYAEQNGYVLGKIFDKMLSAVENCEGFCPCKYALYKKSKPEELEDIRCPCIFVAEDMEKHGKCHCGMFAKGE